MKGKNSTGECVITKASSGPSFKGNKIKRINGMYDLCCTVLCG